MIFVKVFKKIFEPIKYFFFNNKNNTNILSKRASLNSFYGKGVRIDPNTYINDNCRIGDYSYINSNSYIENTEIGKYCSISSGVFIGPYEHNLKTFSTSPLLQSKTQQKGVKIGNDVLISLNVIILDGVSISDGAVIAAGAVVTKNVLPYEVVGGVPAKHIRFRFSSEKIKRLINSQWWKLPLTEIKSNTKDYNREDDNEDCCS